MNRKALFLDRDGVINIDSRYVHKVIDFQFLDGIFEFCRLARSKGYLIFVVTNQAGIGRGYYSVADFNLLTKWMCNKFLAEDVLISKVYFSPYHPEHGVGRYKKDDYSRKPNPGMILQAADEFNLDLSVSVLVGDKITDIQAGITAGVGQNILLTSSSVVREKITCNIVSNFCDAAGYL
jgi:D-glycero-D-manno-heptose 1,7-bisphosphate phosphatase